MKHVLRLFTDGLKRTFTEPNAFGFQMFLVFLEFSRDVDVSRLVAPTFLGICGSVASSAEV